MTEQNQLPLDDGESQFFRLRLFVIGASPNSVRAVANLKIICEQYLKDNYELEIVDVYQQPFIARDEQIIALPLLIKKSPGAERRLIGDMSNTGKVLKGLGIYTGS
ncbi:circadian clock KaiB family protein [Mucilaginibacter sp. cycad4]|uniref:circadian clock KaiB family protein n=1 Tax=Mucilaginibacter sp. cycad4 TaxID=3342096 RepID=UPI002AABA9F5|nr:circadian clock KaiB family protein [Mucilaginibacter gossypii]WPV02184.1 circadian clock KaiB family protein [Mucilaginibacter gossypii]